MAHASIKEARERARDFVAHLEREYSLPIESAYLYGSHAAGRAHQWSDVDVCIVSPLFRDQDPISYLWRRRRAVDIENLIAPVGFTPEDFASQSPSPLLHSIRTSGKLIGK